MASIFSTDASWKRHQWSAPNLGHEWIDARQLTMQDIGAVEQIQCKHCGRDFIILLSNNSIQAVSISVLSFWTLSPDVAERWINNCPGERLPSDEYDRMKRVKEITF